MPYININEETRKKEIMTEVSSRLKKLYPEAACALKWGEGRENGWRLMVMARLSAQCTDARVNSVCEELFKKYPTPEDLANAPINEIEDVIRPCGLYRMKAKDIKSECADVVEKYGGVVPCEMDDLLSLSGVGRKIANLLRGDLYGKPAIVADTHFMRICGRLGMYDKELRDAYKIEKIMIDLVDPEEQSDLCHRIVLFGRDVCSARSPRCEGCPLSDVCGYVKIK